MLTIQALIQVFIGPKHKFKNPNDTPPDYENPDNWAAIPSVPVSQEFEVEGCPRNESPKADLFFVHPTTYASSKHWNAPLAHKRSRRFIDEKVVKGQASVFSGAARIFVPRYRQATFYAYIDTTRNGQLAREFAFEDVKRAFDEFLKISDKRPIILAGHSQGTEYVARLIMERFTDENLRARLVAAYLGGPPLPLSKCDEFPNVPFGRKPDDFGCYITWNTIGGDLSERIKSLWPEHSGFPVINPLSWDASIPLVSSIQNKGSVKFRGKTRRLYKNVTGAACKNGSVIVNKFKPNIYRWVPSLGKNNHHLIDYHLFYKSIYNNARIRVDAYLKARGQLDF